MTRKRVTFDDIAKYTHFSKTTISRYFNNPSSLTPKNQEIIRQALVALDYKENKVARILARGRTPFVGILLPNLYLHYFAELLNRILLTYEEFGYQFLVFEGNENAETERKYLQELLSYQVEGLLVMSHTIPSRELASLSIPVVSVEREDAMISSVNCDNYAGARQAAELLASCGCDVLLHVNTVTPPETPAYQRIPGFLDYCREHSLRHDIFIREPEYSPCPVYQSMASLLEEIEQKYPTEKKGIFFSDDTRANSFLNLLIRKYHTLPPSYRLVGFDNSPISLEAVYSISTVGQQIDRMAFEAVSLLHELIEQRKALEEGADGQPFSPEPVHRVITPVLYRRETTQE